MRLEFSQWLRAEDGRDEYLHASALLYATPDHDAVRWQFIPLEGRVAKAAEFEANGPAAAELEAWARRGALVTTERATRALRRTQIVWGAIVGRMHLAFEPFITIEALDTTTYRLSGSADVVGSIAGAVGVDVLGAE
jgi:hypothetical protein